MCVALQVLFSLPLRCSANCGFRCKGENTAISTPRVFSCSQQPDRRSSSSPLGPFSPLTPLTSPPAGGGAALPCWLLPSRPARPRTCRVAVLPLPRVSLSLSLCVCVCVKGSALWYNAPPPAAASCEGRLSRFVSFPSPGAEGLTGARPGANGLRRSSCRVCVPQPPTSVVVRRLPPPPLPPPPGAARPRLPNVRRGETFAQNPPLVNIEKAEEEPPPSSCRRRGGGQRYCFCRSQGG